jgi:hypothetical protein
MVVSVGKTIGIVLGSFFGELLTFANSDAVCTLILAGIRLGRRLDSTHVLKDS